MYQHLLVPIDGSPLTQTTVEHAVSLALRLGARITFFHARVDFGASSDGAVLHAAAPESFEQAAAGNVRVLFAKAQAAACAAQVKAGAQAVISDHPHDAILNAVSRLSCDAIVMASHGRRGLRGVLLGSVTQRVLQAATVPVVVAAVERNQTLSDAQVALATIRDEHRSLAAVIHGLQRVLAQVRDMRAAPDFALLRAMLFYIEQFPERLHHPKEEAFLFRLLRERTRQHDLVLADLERQHQEGSALFAQLRQDLRAFEGGDSGALQRFEITVGHFAQMQWRHMGAEERLILPAAIDHLSEVDWIEIAQAFRENRDPCFGHQTEEDFNELLVRILNLAT